MDQALGNIPLSNIILKSLMYMGIIMCLEAFICSFTISSIPLLLPFFKHFTAFSISVLVIGPFMSVFNACSGTEKHVISL